MTENILVRLDANHDIGLAHAIRVSSILALLSNRYLLTVAGQGDQIKDFFNGQHVTLDPTDPDDDFFRLIDDIKPSLIIVDHPNLGYYFWHFLSEFSGLIPVVAIDDVGGDINAALILNGTVLDEYHNYPLACSSARLLVGNDYTLIRPVFYLTPWRNPQEPSVVIVVGSGDRACEWALQLMSGQLDLSLWGKVDLIVGRAFPKMVQLQRDCDARGVTLRSGLSGEDMAIALSQAGVALITGGMIVYESLAVGVPAVVFPQIENLIPEANWFSQRGCITNLGFNNGMNISNVEQSVLGLLESQSKRMVMSAIQRSTIDGQGMYRAATEVSKLLAM
jgi:spore coat polysaccharide biosynthesis predicted glycosyltransferase SpsG